MKLDLNNKKMQMTGLAGLMIYIAVILKNGGEQLGQKNHFLSSVIGRILFISGWALMAYSMVGPIKMKMDRKSLMAYGGSLGVVVAVMTMKMMKLTDKQKKPFGILFILSWISVASAVGMGKGKMSKMLGMTALLNVLGSMLIVLPWARTNKVIDNPGMGMFAITFISLAIANSMN